MTILQALLLGIGIGLGGAFLMAWGCVWMFTHTPNDEAEVE